MRFLKFLSSLVLQVCKLVLSDSVLMLSNGSSWQVYSLKFGNFYSILVYLEFMLIITRLSSARKDILVWVTKFA